MVSRRGYIWTSIRNALATQHERMEKIVSPETRYEEASIAMDEMARELADLVEERLRHFENEPGGKKNG